MFQVYDPLGPDPLGQPSPPPPPPRPPPKSLSPITVIMELEAVLETLQRPFVVLLVMGVFGMYYWALARYFKRRAYRIYPVLSADSTQSVAAIKQNNTRKRELAGEWMFSWVHAFTCVVISFASDYWPGTSDGRMYCTMLVIIHTVSYFMVDTILHPSWKFLFHHLFSMAYFIVCYFYLGIYDYVSVNAGLRAMEFGNVINHGLTILKPYITRRLLQVMLNRMCYLTFVVSRIYGAFLFYHSYSLIPSDRLDDQGWVFIVCVGVVFVESIRWIIEAFFRKQRKLKLTKIVEKKQAAFMILQNVLNGASIVTIADDKRD